MDFYDADRHKANVRGMDFEIVRKELLIARVRLRLAQAWADMMTFAYDALLSHGVNFRNLPEYKDTTLLDRAANEEVTLGENNIVEYMRRVKHGITAAIRRKGFKKYEQ